MPAEFSSVLVQYDLPADAACMPIGNGHINWTYRVEGGAPYVLQRINESIFPRPEEIDANLSLAADYLRHEAPDYLFLAPLPNRSGSRLTRDVAGRSWRLYPYLADTLTIEQADCTDQAFHAAAEFARLARRLSGADPRGFCEPIPRFHDLAWRLEQFEAACAAALPDRLQRAEFEVGLCRQHADLAERLARLIGSGALRRRVFHNDTKLNNVLFAADRRRTVAAIDLDTLMPGYFLFDLGDLVRTVVPPVNEEHRDLEQIVFRADFYAALKEGYLSEMHDVLDAEERTHCDFAGPMMTYIMALRFLADYLRGDTYYRIQYPDQNLVRAQNQLRLLEVLRCILETPRRARPGSPDATSD
jgi:Ser/Thr protein kinase RdoA (MazF antagonist)